MTSDGQRRSSLANNQDNENRENRSIRFQEKTEDTDVRHIPVPPAPPPSTIFASSPRRMSATARRISGGSQQLPYSLITPLPPLSSPPLSQAPIPPPPSPQLSQLPPALSAPRASFSQPTTFRRVSISTPNPQRRMSISSQSGNANIGSLSETNGMTYDPSSMATALRMLDDSYISYAQARKNLYSRLYNEGQSTAAGAGPTRLSVGRGRGTVNFNNPWSLWTVTPGQILFSGMIHYYIVIFIIVMAIITFLVICLLLYHTS